MKFFNFLNTLLAKLTIIGGNTRTKYTIYYKIKIKSNNNFHSEELQQILKQRKFLI